MRRGGGLSGPGAAPARYCDPAHAAAAKRAREAARRTRLRQESASWTTEDIIGWLREHEVTIDWLREHEATMCSRRSDQEILAALNRGTAVF